MAKIIGNTTATPNPQSDWNQTDETKADYIKNKPTILTEEDVVELIISSTIDSGKIPVVYTLPTNANDGDICIYSPANVPTVEDSGKLIYVDWDVFNKTITNGDFTQFAITFYDASEEEVGFFYATNTGIGTAFQYTKGDEQWDIQFADGVFDAESSSYTDGETTINLTEAPIGFTLPIFSSLESDHYNVDSNIFYAPIKLMIYRGGWYEYTFDSTVDVGIYHGYEFPENAKDGGLFLYAQPNTLTLADSCKRIYFDWNEFSKPVSEENITSFNVYCNNGVLEGNGDRNPNGCNIWFQRINADGSFESIQVSFSNGTLDSENSMHEITVPNLETETTHFNSIDELPLYFDLPDFEAIENFELNGNAYLFHSEYELMKYQGEEWIAAVEADVSDEQIAAAVSDYIRENPIEVPGVPTKVSQLENDSGFITVEDIPEGGGSVDLSDYYTKQEIDDTINSIRGSIDEIEAMIDESGVLE